MPTVVTAFPARSVTGASASPDEPVVGAGAGAGAVPPPELPVLVLPLVTGADVLIVLTVALVAETPEWAGGPATSA